MKKYWVVEVEIHALSWTLDGSEWLDLLCGHFTPGKEVPDIHWVGP